MTRAVLTLRSPCSGSRTKRCCAAAAASWPMRRCPARFMVCLCARRTPTQEFAASTPPPRADGVLAVLTAADMKAAGVGTIHAHFPMVGRGGGKLIDPVRPALADDRAMHVGQPVALVVATTAALAQDAAELVSIDY